MTERHCAGFENRSLPDEGSVGSIPTAPAILRQFV